MEDVLAVGVEGEIEVEGEGFVDKGLSGRVLGEVEEVGAVEG